jgi:hypothetical protein
MSQKEVARAVAFRFQRISTDSQRRLPTVGKANDYQWILSADFFCSFQIYIVGRRNFDAVHGREGSLDVVQIRLLDATQTL